MAKSRFMDEDGNSFDKSTLQFKMRTDKCQ